MYLASFLNKIFKKGGFILTDADLKDYIIGNPGEQPMKIKLLNKKLHLNFCYIPTYISVRHTQKEI